MRWKNFFRWPELLGYFPPKRVVWATHATTTRNQVAFRGRKDNVTLNSSTFDDPNQPSSTNLAQNTDWTQPVADKFRIRFEIQESGGSASNDTYQVRYLKNSTDWSGGGTAITSSGTNIRVVDSTQYTDGDATTDILTAGTGTFVAGVGDDSDNLMPSSGNIALPANGHTEVEINLQFQSADVVNGDVFRFRVTLSSGTHFTGTYTVPVVTVAAPIAKTIDVAATFTAALVKQARKLLAISGSGPDTQYTRYFDFEGAPDATTITISDTWGGDAWDNVNNQSGANVVEYSTTQAMFGLASGHLQSSGGNNNANFYWNVGAGELSFRLYLYVPAGGIGNQLRLVTFLDGGTFMGALTLTTAEAIQMLDSNGSIDQTMTATVAEDQWVRFEGTFNDGTTASNGSYTIRYFSNALSDTPTETISSTTADLAGDTNTVGRIRFGAVSQPNNIYVDNIVVTTSATIPGRLREWVTSNLPVLSGDILKTIAVTMTATVGLTKAIFESKPVTATLTVARNVAVNVTRALTSSMPAALIKQPQVIKSVSATYSVALTTAITIAKAIALGATLTVAQAVQVGKLLALSLTGTVSRILDIFTTKGVSATYTVAMNKAISVARQLTTILSVGIIKAINITIALGATFTVALQALKVFLKAINVTLSTTVSLVNQVNKTLSLALTGTVSLIKSIGYNIAVGLSAAVDLVTDFIPGGPIPKAIEVTMTATVSMAKAISSTKALTASLLASLARRTTHIITLAPNLTPALTKLTGALRALNATFTVGLATQVGTLILKTIAVTLTATATVAGLYRRKVYKQLRKRIGVIKR